MMGLAGWIWIVVWIAALLLMVWLIVRHPDEPPPEMDALAILRARFARGELSESEFRRACDVLGADRVGDTT